MSEDELLRFTPLEFNKLLEIHSEHSELKYRQQAELMRLQTLYLVNIQLGKKGYKSLHELMPFEWDKEAKIKKKFEVEAVEMTEEDWETFDSILPIGKKDNNKITEHNGEK